MIPKPLSNSQVTSVYNTLKFFLKKFLKSTQPFQTYCTFKGLIIITDTFFFQCFANSDRLAVHLLVHLKQPLKQKLKVKIPGSANENVDGKTLKT